MKFILKKILHYSLLFFLLVNTSFAQSKILFIDVNYIYSQSNIGKKYEKEIINKQSSLNKKLEEKKNTIKKDRELLINQKNILSDIEFKNKNQQLEKKIKQIKLDIENENNQIQKYANNVKVSFYNELMKILAKYSDDNSIEMIINKENILIGKNNLDISEKILTIVNKNIVKLAME